MQRQNETNELNGADRPRVKIYIDGPNFYHGLQTIGKSIGNSNLTSQEWGDL